MFFYSDAQLDQWILDDMPLGDLTTRALGIGGEPGRMLLSFRKQTRASGLAASAALLRKLGLAVELFRSDGEDVAAGEILLEATGNADALHMGWKVSQNIIEWSSGVADYTARMVSAGKQIRPNLHVACTRKSIPGTKSLANAAVVHGGGILHRGGGSETLLLFANHRLFAQNSDDFAAHVDRLRQAAPEKKIIVEADSLPEALTALEACPDVLQLDKFSPEDLREIVRRAEEGGFGCLVSAAGGVTVDNITEYAATGVHLVVTSAPYYAKPADVRVVMERSR